MKDKVIPIPIYFGKLIIVMVDNWKEVDEKYNTKIDENLYEAVMFEITDKNEYVIAIKMIDWSIITHEVVHIVNAIFLKCGIELDRNNDEPQAYLTGWIVNEIDIFIHELSKL